MLRTFTLKRLALLLLPSLCWCQGPVQGSQPQIIQSAIGALPMGMNNNIASGNWLVGCLFYETSSSSPTTITVVDSNGIVPTISMGTAKLVTGIVGNIFDPNGVAQMFWGQATSSGNVNLNYSGSTPPRQNTYVVMEATLPSGYAFDQQGSGSANSTSTSTSTATRDEFIATCWAPNLSVPVFPQLQWAGQATNGDYVAHQLGWQMAGAAGTATSSIQTSSGTYSGVMVSVAFKPTTLNIGTTQNDIPTCASGVLCYFTLTGTGGGSTRTWSRSSGTWPTGCSDSNITSNSDGTATISCTPTQLGSFSLTFQATDGTLTATKALTLAVNQDLECAPLKAECGFGTTPCSLSGVAIGDMLQIKYLGGDTHGDEGYLDAPYNVSDSCGDGFTRLFPIAGGLGGAINVFGATATCNGTVTFAASSGPGSPLVGVVEDVGSLQPIFDNVTVNQQMATGSTASLTSALNTIVTGEYLFTGSTMNCGVGGGGSCVMATSTNSPWNLVQNGVSGFAGSVFGDYELLAPTVSSYSATSNYSDSTNPSLSGDPLLQVEYGLRPAYGACPLVRHRAEWFNQF